MYTMDHDCKTEIAAPTMVASETEAGPANATIIRTPKRMTVKKAHDMLGPINEKAVRKTAIALG
jgi:hypothetical protein